MGDSLTYTSKEGGSYGRTRSTGLRMLEAQPCPDTEKGLNSNTKHNEISKTTKRRTKRISMIINISIKNLTDLLYSSSTVEARRSRHAWLGNGLDGLDSRDKTPHPYQGGGFSVSDRLSRMTSTEIRIMEEERVPDVPEH